MILDAIIVGAGPAGSVLARLLARQGWSIALVEKSIFPRAKVCGEFISATTLPLLADCGIGDAFAVQAGPPVRTVALYAGASMVEAPLPAPGRALGREHLDLMLRDAAVDAGASLFQPAECLDLARAGDGVTCTLATGEILSARIGVAAAGSWNTQGRFALRPKAERPSDLFAFKTHMRGGGLPAGVMPLLAFPGGYGGMVESDGGRTSISCCIRRDVMGRARARHGGRAGEAVLAHMCETTTGIGRALENARDFEPWLGVGPIHPGRRPVCKDGIFQLGNLAGEAHPIIAEGISMAIQSATLLAGMLVTHQSAGKIDNIYQRAWRRRFAPRLLAASAFAHLAMNEAARPLVAALAGAAPSLLTWGAALAGKANASRR